MKLQTLLRGLEILQLHADDQLEIAGVQYDSRQVTAGDLFVAVQVYQAAAQNVLHSVAHQAALMVLHTGCLRCLLDLLGVGNITGFLRSEVR